MTLVVETPPTYEPERRYVLGVVLGEHLGLDWEHRPGERSDVRVTVAGDDDGRELSLPDGLFATAEGAWLTHASLPEAPLRWTEAGGRRLPVLFGPPEPEPAADGDGDAIRLGVDVLGGAFFMLTRYEEAVLEARDAYGRFPAASSLAHREGFLGIAVVDAYVELLWEALARLWPGLERRPRAFGLAISHDVDDPLATLGRNPPMLARQLAADLVSRRDPALALRRVRSWAPIGGADHRHDPYNTFDFLMEVSERHGVVSAFNFLATERVGARDGSYTLEHPWVRSLMARIHARGHEVGYHAGFDTYRDAERTEAEFGRLRTVAAQLGVAQEAWGGRQHYLRWENPCTWGNWERAGLDYDSTLGFAETVGFRVGTCHEFGAFHLRERRPLRLRERPLLVMDVTLFRYMALRPEGAVASVLDIARECRRTGGTLTLLWHNSTLPTAGQRRWYAELIAAVAQDSSSS
jgi:hypothetical protein